MRRFLLILASTVVVFLVVAVLAVLFGGPLISPYAKNLIESKLNESGTGEYKISKLHIYSLFPFHAEVQSLQGRLHDLPLEFSVATAAVTVKPLRYTWRSLEDVQITIKVEKPQFNFRQKAIKGTQPPPPTAEPDGAGGAALAAFNTNIRIDFQLLGGGVEVELQSADEMSETESSKESTTLKNFKAKEEPTTISVRDLNLQFKTDHFLNTEAPKDVAVQGRLALTPLLANVELPVRIRIPSLQASPANISAPNFQIEFAGLQASGSGQSALDKESHNWRMKFDIAAVEKLPVPPAFLPPGRWQGGLKGDLHFWQKSSEDGPKILGSLQTQELKGYLEINTDGLKMRGPLAPVIDVQFAYDKVFSAKHLQAKVDLSALDLTYQDLMRKPAGVPMRFEVVGQANQQSINLQRLDAVFSKLRMQAQGQVGISEGGLSNLQLQVQPSPLNGLEKFIPPLAAMPLNGEIALAAQVQGNLFDPASLSTRLSSLRLKNVSGQIKYQSEDKTTILDGPFFAHMDGNASLKYIWPTQASLNADVRLSDMRIQAGMYKKDKGEPLRVKTAAKVAGHFDPKLGVEKSPLKLSGRVEAQLPRIKIPAPEVAEPDKTAAKETQEPLFESLAKLPDPEPLLPNWPLIQNADLTLALSLLGVDYDQLKVDGIQLNGSLKKGIVAGQTRIQKILGGSANFSSFQATQLTTQPLVSARVAVNNLNVPQFVSVFFKEYEGYVQEGAVDSQLSVRTPMPGTKNWLLKLTSSGQFNAKKVKMRDNVIEELIGDKFSKFAKDKKLLSKRGVPLIADVTTKFAVEKGVAKVNPFQAKTTDDNEFLGSGQIRLDLEANLKGNLYLSKIDIQGDVRRANSDEKGRFVVPIEFKGNLLQPKLDVATSTLETIAKNTLKYRAKAAEKEIKERVKKEAKDELKKRLKDIFK